MDNLRMHYAQPVKELAAALRFELLYNASYSSHLNPIERLWALSKRRFGSAVLTDVDLKSKSDVQAFIAKSLIEVPRISLQRHILTCMLRI